ncbi:MAG: PAS domain S-box protein [Chloroflexi bacterium]|nr:PAS domain S-box protein [Chloroflexota bacterium]MCC6892089.1 PAS domain S-box protein [Anaerolineae bacterium]
MLRRLSDFLTPPVFNDEEQTRNARLVYVLILAILTLDILNIILDYIFIPVDLGLGPNLATLIVGIIMLVLVRRGYVTPIGMALALSSWVTITFLAYTTDGLTNSIVSLYVLPIIIAGLLINLRTGLVVAGLSIMSALAFAFAADMGKYPLTDSTIPMSMRLGYYVTLFSFTGVTIYLSIGAIQNALARTQATENRLRESNGRLQAESEARTRIQQELEDSERRWRFALDGSETGVWDMNLETDEIFRSVGYLELLGYTAEEMTAFPDTSILFHPDDAEEVMRKRDTYLQQPDPTHETPPYEDKIRLLHADGTYHWYLYRGKMTEFGTDQQPKRFMGTLTDVTHQQKMEAALEEAELRWRFALEGSDAGVWDANLQTGVTYRSPRYLEMIGYTAETLPEFRALVHRDDLDRTIDKRTRFLNGESKTYQDEFRLRCGDGIYRWFSSQGKIIQRNPDGTALRIVGTVKDITLRKELEETIRLSEEAYRNLFENNPNPMWVYNRETSRIVAVNDAAMHLYGYTQAEFFNMTFWDLMAHDDSKRLEAVISNGMNDFSAPDVWTHQSKSGDLLQVEVSAHETIFQNQRARIVLIRDLTAQKAVEESLRSSQELFGHVFDSVPVGVALSRLKDGTYISVNPYFAEMLDFAREDMIGHTGINLKIVDSVSRHKHIESILKAAPESYKIEQRLRAKTGRSVDTLTTAQVIKLAHEDALLSIVVDITAIKRAERERMQINMLQSELDNQREVVELKERFISGVSHEFRSPLTIMLSGTGILRLHDEKFNTQQRIERLQKIETQIHYLSDLLDRVLTISKARAGKFQFIPRELDVVRFCRELFEDFKLTDNNRHVFVFEAAGNFDHAKMDEKLMQHILMNLMSNAVKYSPEGKTVKMRLERSDDEVVIHIADQGIGIPEEEQHQVFEPFFRSKNAETIKGTGLGLSITKESVDAHLGHIAWQSQQGIGTTFIVRLPGGFQPVMELESEA